MLKESKTDYPEKIKVISDCNELIFVEEIRGENKAVYKYTKSKTKKDRTVELTLDKINKLTKQFKNNNDEKKHSESRKN